MSGVEIRMILVTGLDKGDGGRRRDGVCPVVLILDLKTHPCVPGCRGGRLPDGCPIDGGLVAESYSLRTLAKTIDGRLVERRKKGEITCQVVDQKLIETIKALRNKKKRD